MTTEPDSHDERDPRDGWSLQTRLPSLEPPASLSLRVSRSLRQLGVVRRRRSFPLGSVTAAALVVLGAFVAGRVSAPGAAYSTTEGHRFLILLYAPPPGSTPDVVDDVAAERTWARSVAAGGHKITGEKLSRQVVRINDDSNTPAIDADLEGFFVVDAASTADAEGIARSSPHARRGGRVVVRPIDPT